MASALTAAMATEVIEVPQERNGKSNTKPWHQWKPGLWERFSGVLTSREFQIAIQTALGQTLFSLFTFIPALRFPACYLVSVFYYQVLRSRKSTHLGATLIALSQFTPALISGMFVAAVVLTIAHAAVPLEHLTLSLCMWAPVGIFVICVLRATDKMRTEGIMGLTTFFTTFYMGLSTNDKIVEIYTLAVLPMLLVMCVTWATHLIDSSLLLPSLAIDELRTTFADATKGIGMAISHNVSYIFEPEESRHSAEEAAEKVDDGILSQTEAFRHMDRVLMTDDQYISATEDRHFLDIRTDPKIAHAANKAAADELLSLLSVQSKLNHCKPLLKQAGVEPPWLASCPMDLDKWSQAVTAASLLLNRASALETLLVGHVSLVRIREVERVTDVDIIPTLRLLYAQLALSCAALGTAIESEGRDQGGCKAVLSPSWGVLSLQLRAALSRAVRSRWAKAVAAESPVFARTHHQIRIMLYLGAITAGIMDAMASFEDAVIKAMGGSPAGGRLPSSSLLEGSLDETLTKLCKLSPVVPRPHPKAAPRAVWVIGSERKGHWLPVSHSLPDPGPHPRGNLLMPLAGSMGDGGARRSVPPLRPAKGSWIAASLAAARGGRAPSPAAPGTAAVEAAAASDSAKEEPPAGECKPPDAGSYFQGCLSRIGWLTDLIKMHMGQKIYNAMGKVVTEEIPPAVASRQAFVSALRNNFRLQFVIKLWVACSIALILVIVLTYETSDRFYLVFGVIAVSVSVNETVEMTVNRQMLRIIGTLVGGTLGFLWMLHPDLAGNALALALQMAIFAAIGGVLYLGKYKYAVSMAMIAMNSIVLTQFVDLEGTDDVQLYALRIVTIVVGLLIGAMVELILPRYNTLATLCEFGVLFSKAAHVTGELYEGFYEELALLDPATPVSDGPRGLEKIKRMDIQKMLLEPMSVLQDDLHKQAVIWKRGVLVTPRVIPDMQLCLREMGARLVAFRLLLEQKASISASFSVAPFYAYMSPIHPKAQILLERLNALGEAVAELLHDHPTPELLTKVQEATSLLCEANLDLRKDFVWADREARSRDGVGNKGFADHMRDSTPDDNIRLSSCLFCFNQLVETSILLARTIASHEWILAYCARRQSRWAMVWLPQSLALRKVKATTAATASPPPV